MKVHKNDRLTSAGGALLAERIESSWSMKSAAESTGASIQTARKWADRHRLGRRESASRPQLSTRERPSWKRQPGNKLLVDFPPGPERR
ncbi:MAG: hypothetical protein EON87_06485 [Brevundimonas sp.]|nr:MAG: hypothetical protein EON87_06485 [Brevundimonas sp.]